MDEEKEILERINKDMQEFKRKSFYLMLGIAATLAVQCILIVYIVTLI